MFRLFTISISCLLIIGHLYAFSKEKIDLRALGVLYNPARIVDFCTAFVIGENEGSLILVSAGHCAYGSHFIPGAERLNEEWVKQNPPPGLRVKIFALALIGSLDYMFALAQQESEEKITPLKFARNSKMLSGSLVKAIGYSDGIRQEISLMFLNKIDDEVLAFAGIAKGGMSGAPIINSKDEVVGIVIGSGKGKTESGEELPLVFAVPVERLQEIIIQLKKL